MFQRYKKSLLDFIKETTQGMKDEAEAPTLFNIFLLDPKKSSRPTQGIAKQSIIKNAFFDIKVCGKHREFDHSNQVEALTVDISGKGIFPGVDMGPDLLTKLRCDDNVVDILPNYSCQYVQIIIIFYRSCVVAK